MQDTKGRAIMTEAAILERITRTIVDHFHPERVVLFGSRARGDADAESDFDLLVEMDSAKRPPERAIEVSAVFGLHEWPMDIFVYTPQEMERHKKIRGTLASIVEAEGAVLYERS